MSANSRVTPSSRCPVFMCIVAGAMAWMLLCCSAPRALCQTASNVKLPTFLAGADVSFYKFIEKHGGVYKFHGRPMDVLKILKNEHCNFVRLRLWHHPTAGEIRRWPPMSRVNTLAYTVPLARKARSLGLTLDIDMHLYNTWTSEGHQNTPPQWRGLTLPQLKVRLFNYCKRVITTLRKAGGMPQIVQPGNEINGGILWPMGSIFSRRVPGNGWVRFTSLLKAAIAGIRAGSAGHPPLIMIQLARTSRRNLINYFNHLNAYHVPYDIISITYYPNRINNMVRLRHLLNGMAARFHKPVMVAETAYPWTGNAHARPWPMTPRGQAACIADVIKTVKAVPDGLGRGVLYWGAEYMRVPPAFWGGPWVKKSLFDSHGNVLPAMAVLGASTHSK